MNQLVLTDTSDSEMEFDFDVTPPAGTVKPPKLLKRRQINHSTQTSPTDKKVRTKYPKQKTSPYWRTYDCAAGDRYRSTAFGAPGEVVFEDGVFGFQGGGAHGEAASAGGRPKSKQIWGSTPGAPLSAADVMDVEVAVDRVAFWASPFQGLKMIAKVKHQVNRFPLKCQNATRKQLRKLKELKRKLCTGRK